MYGYIATAYDISAVTGTSLAGVPISLWSDDADALAVWGTADFGGSEPLAPFNRSRSVVSSRSLLSTAGDITSGQPGCADVPVIGGGTTLADASGCTCSRGGREGVRAWEAGLGLEDEVSPEALRAACFC
jgi:hypothetical protein